MTDSARPLDEDRERPHPAGIRPAIAVLDPRASHRGVAGTRFHVRLAPDVEAIVRAAARRLS